MNKLGGKARREHVRVQRWPRNNLTFEAWYQRDEDFFMVNGAELDEAAKVRLLMRKLGGAANMK